jgi:hypothetical protein
MGGRANRRKFKRGDPGGNAMPEEKQWTGATLSQPRREPKVLAFVTDARHAAQVKQHIDTVACPQASDLLELWREKGGDRFVIVVAPLRSAQPIGVFVADGPHSLRRQMARAIESLRGVPCFWLLGLSDHADAIAGEVLNDTSRWSWWAFLEGITVGGHA